MSSGSDQRRRAFWLKQLHQWHWVSSALCLIGMLLFAATGFTLNHAADIDAHPKVSSREAKLTPSLLMQLKATAASNKIIPDGIIQWASEQMSVNLRAKSAEWSEDEVYVSLPRPGGDAWLSIDLEQGLVRHENTDRGWISYLNDLHKGRNTGLAWKWFIDIFAFACLIFCITGFFLLQLHAANRPTTWPVVGLGLVIPLVLAIIFIH
jgi:hypothetical protein